MYAAVPATAGGAEVTFPTEEEARRVLDDEEDGSDVSDTDPQDEEDDDHWDTIREGSIARRSAWRKPRAAWIYPFVMGTIMTIGMGVAPKSEVYVNLACLVHPPGAPSLESSAMSDIASSGRVTAPWIDGPISVNGSSPAIPAIEPTTPTTRPLSAVDKWFLKIQKDIYEYEIAHPHSSDPHTTVVPTSTRPSPNSPTPTSRPDHKDPESPTPSSPSKQPSSPPFHEIDPALCKRDPQVQAIAAKLTMGKHSCKVLSSI